jgi:3-methyladenine DNA glycosylase AlkC
MEPLKEMFNKKFYERLAGEFQKADQNFNSERFLAEVTQGLENLSLNERMRNTSVVLKNHLPVNYKHAVSTLFRVIPQMGGGYTSLLFPDYVGLYGHGHFELSMEALKYFTSFGSSEFAIREFLKRDFKKTIETMHTWAGDRDHHVRRLASEGSRPRLPWSFKLDQVISEPSHTQGILERLKEDPELYVRKSVANHLNDISKDNPEYMIKLVGGWSKTHPYTSWIVKHASRSLIKKGDADSLAIFNYEKDAKVAIRNFKLAPAKLKLGKALQFSFDLVSQKAKVQKLVIDYVIHYRKKSGELSPKVFKLKELHLRPKETIRISKKQVFKDFTTRKHEPGIHVVEIQVNGKILQRKQFHLQA